MKPSRSTSDSICISGTALVLYSKWLLQNGWMNRWYHAIIFFFFLASHKNYTILFLSEKLNIYVIYEMFQDFKLWGKDMESNKWPLGLKSNIETKHLYFFSTVSIYVACILELQRGLCDWRYWTQTHPCWCSTTLIPNGRVVILLRT